MFTPFQSPIPASLQAPIAIVRSRHNIAKIAPQIDQMMTDASTTLLQITGTTMPAVGCTVTNEYIALVLQESLAINNIPEKLVCPHAIIIELPAVFEEAIAQMVGQTPYIFNWTTTSLQIANTYLSWECHLPTTDNLNSEQVPTQVWVMEHDLGDIPRRGWECASLAKEQGWWRWQPVVLVSGQRVAVGGFPLDDSFLDRLQGTSFAATNFSPFEFSTDDEIAEAKPLVERFGETPWFQNFWQTEDSNVLGVRVLNCECHDTDADAEAVGLPEL
jgi:hypothetical protein